MTDYQVQVVGMDSFPTEHRKGRWDFLDAYVAKLQDGQALRLILPKGTSVTGAVARWQRKSEGRGKYVSEKQADGTIKIWLWLKDNNNANL